MSSEGEVRGYYQGVFYRDAGDGFPSTAFQPIEITDQMVLAAAEALAEEYGRLGIRSRVVVNRQPRLTEIARTALRAALVAPPRQRANTEREENSDG